MLSPSEVAKASSISLTRATRYRIIQLCQRVVISPKDCSAWIGYNRLKHKTERTSLYTPTMGELQRYLIWAPPCQMNRHHKPQSPHRLNYQRERCPQKRVAPIPPLALPTETAVSIAQWRLPVRPQSRCPQPGR